MCVFSFLLPPFATKDWERKGWFIPCCCGRLGEGAYYLPQGSADTITPGERKEKMEVPTGTAYPYLIPPCDAEWRWKLSSSLDLTESLMLGTGAMIASTSRDLEDYLPTELVSDIPAGDGRTTSFCWREMEDYLFAWHQQSRDQSAVCFSEVERVSGRESGSSVSGWVE